jgi:hypothetical protein
MGEFVGERYRPARTFSSAVTRANVRNPELRIVGFGFEFQGTVADLEVVVE